MTEAAKIAADLRVSGQPMVLTRVSSGTYDPVTGLTSGAVTQTWTVYGITKSYRDGIVSLPGTTILAGDKKATVAALDSTGAEIIPTPGDTLTIMGVVWRVIAVDTLSPQGEALLHNVQVRK